MLPAPFEIEVLAPEARTVELRLRGELDLATVARLSDALDELDFEQLQVLRIDLSHLDFIDSMGLAAIFRADSGMRAAGGRLTLRPGSEQVQRAFELAGMLGDLSFEH